MVVGDVIKENQRQLSVISEQAVFNVKEKLCMEENLEHLGGS